MKHVQDELNRIGERIAAGADPFEHAGLYAAQQALCWAAQPEAFASPYEIIARNGAGRECCSALRHPLPFSDSASRSERP